MKWDTILPFHIWLRTTSKIVRKARLDKGIELKAYWILTQPLRSLLICDVAYRCEWIFHVISLSVERSKHDTGRVGIQIPKIVDFFSFLGWGENWIHLVRRPLIGLLYQPRAIYDECGAVGGMRIGRGNEVLGENMPQCNFVYHKSRMTWPGLEPGPPLWAASD
jgi:hypothetical protein